MKRLLLITVMLISSITNAQDFDFACGLTSEQKKEARSIELEALKAGLPTGYIAFATDGSPVFYTITGPSPCDQHILGEYLTTVTSTLGDLTDPEYATVLTNANGFIADANAEITRLANIRAPRITELQDLFTADQETIDNGLTLSLETTNCEDTVGILGYGNALIDVQLVGGDLIEELDTTSWDTFIDAVERQIVQTNADIISFSFEGRLAAYYADNHTEPSSLAQSIKDAADAVVNTDERKAFLKSLNHTTEVVVGDAYGGNGEITVVIDNMFLDTGVSGNNISVGGGITGEEFRTITLKVIQRIWKYHTADNQIPLIPTGLTKAQYDKASLATTHGSRHTLVGSLANTFVSVGDPVGRDNLWDVNAPFDSDFFEFTRISTGESTKLYTIYFGDADTPPSDELGEMTSYQFRQIYLYSILRVYEYQYPDAPALTVASALANIFDSNTEPGYLPDVLAEQAMNRASGSRTSLFLDLENQNTKLDITVTGLRVKIENTHSSTSYEFYYSNFKGTGNYLADLDDDGIRGIYEEVIRASWNVLRL